MTIKDIADACGVSVSTVSRVLNKHPDVSRAVRERVMEAVKTLHYVPNNGARDLVRSSSDAVGVVVRGMGNLFFSDIIKTVSSELDSCGLTMVLRYLDSDGDEVEAGALLQREKKLRGLIFLGGRFDYTPEEMHRVSVPYVCCSYTNRFGTLDGANVEIVEKAGLENNYIFGGTVAENEAVRDSYVPRALYESDGRLRRAVDTLVDGTVETDDGLREIHRSLLDGTNWQRPDNYFVLRDFESYREARIRALTDWKDRLAFGGKCLRNVAAAGHFSSDRSIREYAENIWMLE